MHKYLHAHWSGSPDRLAGPFKGVTDVTFLSSWPVWFKGWEWGGRAGNIIRFVVQHESLGRGINQYHYQRRREEASTSFAGIDRPVLTSGFGRLAARNIATLSRLFLSLQSS